jgi:protein-tyrosine phosphatase
VKTVCWITRTGLGIASRPRGEDWLEDDMLRLKNEGIQTLVSTIEEWEARVLGLAEEDAIAERLGLHFISYPMLDRSVPPDQQQFRKFVTSLARRLETGEKIGVHCRGCIGRSTLVTACTLIVMGWSASDALSAIEIAREFPVPDTDEQRAWILAFGAQR